MGKIRTVAVWIAIGPGTLANTRAPAALPAGLLLVLMAFVAWQRRGHALFLAKPEGVVLQ